MKLYSTVSVRQGLLYDRRVDRRARYVDAALRLFLEHGFNGATMDQVVASAGGSKATLYRYFDSKEALFEAIIDDVAAPVVGSDEVHDDWSTVSLEDGLHRLGTLTARAALDRRTIEMLRLALGEQARFPQLAHTLYDHGPARTYARLREFLAAKVRDGEVEIGDLQIAAEQFLGGIIGHQQLRSALTSRRVSQRDLEARINAGIRAFVATYARARIAP